jgi:L-alanine-DL-glutamate epimerase-like enolase superfamily enzyme
LLELQWDETPAFHALAPALPRAQDGSSALPDHPGLGIALDLSTVSA